MQVSAPKTQLVFTPVIKSFAWESSNEEPSSSGQNDPITTTALWEQLNVTRDSSDYLWYMTE